MFMIMDSANAIAMLSGPSESQTHNNRINSFSESSGCQEEKKESGSSCDEINTKRLYPLHQKQTCSEEIVADPAQKQSRCDSTATISSGSSSSSGSVPSRAPQHSTLRTPDHSNATKGNELLGLSLFTYSREASYVDSNGIPTNSSDDALERYASRIRQELRHKEMMELAEAAERAAEAGEESFAVRPSTFGSSEWSTMDSSILAPKTPPAATVNRPHGLAPLLVRKRIEKIGVTELRDVHEVFPDFGEFHTHLRTHLVRGGVDRKTTIFKEKSNKNNGGRFPLSSSSGKSRGLNFLRDLNDWISPSNETALQQDNPPTNCSSAWDIGSIISEHIIMSSSKSPTSQLHPETTSSKQKSAEEYHLQSPTTSDVRLPALLSMRREILALKRKTVCRALFDDDDVPQSQFDIQDTQSTHLANAQHQEDVYAPGRDPVRHRADFVTPVRLRDIRRQSDTDALFERFMSSSSLLDSPLNIVKERKQRLEKVDVVTHDSNSSISSILLPRLLSKNSLDTSRSEKKEKRTNDDRINACRSVENLCDEGGEDMPINGYPIMGSFLSDGVAPGLSKGNSGLDEMEADHNDDVRLNTQLIHVNDAPNYKSSIQAPLRDECGCLSIATNSSLESHEASSLNQDAQLPKPVSVHEDSSSFAGRSNPLADLFSRMSPGRKGFHSTKENRLYFRSKENDAFLNNYLYCGKPIERCRNEIPSHHPLGICHDTPNTCIELNVGSCCTAILPDTFSSDIHRTAAAQSFVSLGGTPSVKSEAEIWFDRATEGFDHFLEQWSGVPSTSAFSTWNISFQAPTLNKKIVPVPHADTPVTTSNHTLENPVSESGTQVDLDSLQ